MTVYRASRSSTRIDEPKQLDAPADAALRIDHAHALANRRRAVAFERGDLALREPLEEAPRHEQLLVETLMRP
jgi:hypothetical protein